MDAPTIRVIGFKTEYLFNPKTKKNDREVELVEYAPVHAIMTSRITDRVANMMPPEAIDNDDDGKKLSFMRARWEMIEPSYRAWKDGREMPLDGTPLAVWPGVTAEQAEALRRVGLRTVEDVATLTDSVMGKVHLPNVRDLVTQAKAFLEAADRSVVADQMAKQQDEIDALKEQLSAAMELLEEANKPKKGKAKAEAEDEQEEAGETEKA